MLYNEHTDTNILMDNFGYSRIQKRVFDNISDYISSTLVMDEIGCIEKHYVPIKKTIRWIFIGTHYSYTVYMWKDSITITFSERNHVRDNGTRCAYNDDIVWEVCVFFNGHTVGQRFITILDEHKPRKDVESDIHQLLDHVLDVDM